MRRVLLVALVASCYRSSPSPQLEARIDKLERRVAEQDRQLAAMRSSDQGSVESAALAANIADLNAKLDRMMAGALPPRKPERAPDETQIYAVPIGTSPVEGPANAKVTMIMAFDFACPYCRRSWDTVGALEKKYGPNLRVVYKHMVVHPATAQYPAQAACAANRQGKFRALAELIWTKSFDDRDFEHDHIDALAKQARLDMRRYKRDLESCADEVKADMALMKKLAVTGTPSFFINGHFTAGARPQDEFEATIDAELARANAAIAAGTPADKVYETEVLAKGLPEVPAP
jgi:protein-disulfide isomerase